MPKLPAFQFYPGDWRKDPGVQALDFEARGVWFEILCLMHESDRRGVLLLNGASMADEALARLLGIDCGLLKQILSKIEAYGVASREDGTGALVCRRMMCDEHLRQVRAKAGSLGGKAGHLGGRPSLLNQNSSKTEPTEEANEWQNNPPSISSSSSITSSEEENTPVVPASGDGRQAKTQTSNLPTIEEAVRISKLFNRKVTTAWSDKEIRAFKKLMPIAGEDLDLLEAYYAIERAKGDDGIHRRDLLTFLNNFAGEIDRARLAKMEKQPAASAQLPRGRIDSSQW